MANENRTTDEKVLQRLRKLYALATQGVGGEKMNAQHLLYELLDRYGLTVSAIDENQKTTYTFDAQKKYHGLICNLFVNYFGGNERFKTDLHIYGYNFKRGLIKVDIECTPWEFIEFKELVDWHTANYAREWRKVRKNFSSAYIDKHNLYATNRNEWFEEMMAKRKDKQPDFQSMMIQSGLAMGMDNVSHRKAIESGNTDR